MSVFIVADGSAAGHILQINSRDHTNHHGKLDAGDTDWSLFKIMVTNADGTTSLETMAQLAITSIGLTPDTTSLALPDGSAIDGETTYTTTTGSGAAACR